jgi:5'-phosphate synthase pdxT subunit
MAACCRAAVRREGPLRIGVLALQGDFDAHRRMLESLEADTTEVRTPDELAGLDGLVIPGGESTTISMGMEREGLDQAIPSFHDAGGPIL